MINTVISIFIFYMIWIVYSYRRNDYIDLNEGISYLEQKTGAFEYWCRIEDKDFGGEESTLGPFGIDGETYRRNHFINMLSDITFVGFGIYKFKFYLFPIKTTHRCLGSVLEFLNKFPEKHFVRKSEINRYIKKCKEVSIHNEKIYKKYLKEFDSISETKAKTFDDFEVCYEETNGKKPWKRIDISTVEEEGFCLIDSVGNEYVSEDVMNWAEGQNKRFNEQIDIVKLQIAMDPLLKREGRIFVGAIFNNENTPEL